MSSYRPIFTIRWINLLILAAILGGWPTPWPTRVWAQAPDTLYLPVVTNSKPTTKPAGVPVINSFSASPAQIHAGSASTLTWSVTDVTNLQVSGIGAVTGVSVSVQPTQTTVYMLSATNAVGTATAQVTVTVTSSDAFAYTTFLMPYAINSVVTVSRQPQVAVDSSGGVHVVYTANYVDDEGKRPAYYAYCAAKCDQKANFSVAALGDNMSFAQLALDPQGHPRLMLTTWPLVNNDFSSPWHWDYGECNSNCTDATQWIFTNVAVALGASLFSDGENNQSFTLDAQGYPRLLFTAEYSAVVPEQPVGTFYTYCAGDCTQRTNWQTTKLDDARWYSMALRLTAEGLPRMAYTLPLGEPDYKWGLLYVECADVACNSGASNLVVTNASSQGFGGATFALKLDKQGRPRLAYYPGYADDGSLPGTKLYYLTCDANCTQASTWQALNLGLPDKTPDGAPIFEGENGVDLTLDAQDRPRIAFRMGFSLDELGYIWCNANCTAGAEHWTYHVIWSTAAQTEDLGLPPREGCPDCHPPIPPCPLGFWDAGYWPSLALDRNNNPWIVYEIQEQSGGGSCEAKTWAHMTRLATFTQP